MFCWDFGGLKFFFLCFEQVFCRDGCERPRNWFLAGATTKQQRTSKSWVQCNDRKWIKLFVFLPFHSLFYLFIFSVKARNEKLEHVPAHCDKYGCGGGKCCSLHRCDGRLRLSGFGMHRFSWRFTQHMWWNLGVSYFFSCRRVFWMPKWARKNKIAVWGRLW